MTIAPAATPQRSGGRVGPDLSGINNKTKEELLTSILNPSYAIEPRFVNYLVTTRDGRMYDGVIANETPSAITLRGGSEEGDQRKNIADIRASSVSLMPDGLDENLSKQDLSDFVVQDFRLFGNPSGQRQGQGVSGPRGGKDEIFQINESLRTTGGKHTLRVGFTGNRYRDTFPEAMRPVGEHRCLHAARAVAARKCRAQ